MLGNESIEQVPNILIKPYTSTNSPRLVIGQSKLEHKYIVGDGCLWYATQKQEQLYIIFEIRHAWPW